MATRDKSRRISAGACDSGSVARLAMGITGARVQTHASGNFASHHALDEMTHAIHSRECACCVCAGSQSVSPNPPLAFVSPRGLSCAPGNRYSHACYPCPRRWRVIPCAPGMGWSDIWSYRAEHPRRRPSAPLASVLLANN